jgi:hypothetical protein
VSILRKDLRDLPTVTWLLRWELRKARKIGTSLSLLVSFFFSSAQASNPLPGARGFPRILEYRRSGNVGNSKRVVGIKKYRELREEDANLKISWVRDGGDEGRMDGEICRRRG